MAPFGALHPIELRPAILSNDRADLGASTLSIPLTLSLSVTVEVVGTGSDGTEPSLLLSVQRHGVYSSDVTLLKRYMFNCGEGTQRLCGENGVKLSSLDSMFFTRFDVNSVSGVPGMVFALSTSGTASLKLHGPVGLRGFLVAIQSFVRRKYPQITCVEISDTTSGSSGSPDITQDQASNLNCEAWSSSEDQSDQHMRIFPVVLRATGARAETNQGQAGCIMCGHGDTVLHTRAADTKPNQPLLSIRTGRETASESDEHTEFRTWLLAFYTSKVPDKVAYVDVILNRYRGRFDDLKVQLCAKYGEMDSVADGATETVSSDSSSDDEDSDKEDDEPDFAALPFNRDWLLKFYRRYQPEKLLHVDRVLKQFSGREDTLKQMLLQKYWTPRATIENGDDDAPQSKRRKLESKASSKATTTTTTSGGDGVPREPEKVFVTPQQPKEAAEPPTSSSSLCYIMKFLHGLHAVVWIIDCRSMNHIDDLITRFQAPSAASGCEDHRPVLVVHFSPSSVLLNLKYQTWMASLGPTTQQLVFDGASLRSAENGVFSWVFRASAKHTLKQQSVFGSADATAMWSHLGNFLASEATISSAGTNERRQRQILWKLENGHEVHVAQSKQRFQLLRKSEDDTNQVTSDYERTGWGRQQDKSDEDTGGGDDDSKVPEVNPDQLGQGDPPSINKETAMKLIILGTGSAAPSKLRGSTGIYLELKPSSLISILAKKEVLDTKVPVDIKVPVDTKVPDSMLIDCGEGTFGQLHRQFGTDTTARIGGLRCIWISHSHADHQCGLVRVLSEFVQYHAMHRSLNSRGLLVLAPQSVLLYASSWMSHILDSCGVHDAAHRSSLVGFATCREFNQPQHRFRPELFAQIGSVVAEITSVPVWHCYDSYGLVLQLRNGQKIVYSGDTRPCRQLVAAGMHASLLIHEATFDDSMADDAVKKKHSTVGEALEIARQMRAQEVVLTHFSQRYPKLPPPVTATQYDGAGDGGQAPQLLQARVHCAFDGYIHYVPTD